jgi:uncharacterized membrane protein YraQ (UPF0718 family)
MTAVAAQPSPPGLRPERSRTDRARAVGVPIGVILGAIVLIRVTGLDDVGPVHNVLLIFAGLLVEALPFILLGAIVSAAIETFMPQSFFARFARAPKPVQVGGAAFGGMLFPVCECGSVPVARRLMLRGLAPTAAVTFMLAAPIVNPIVILSTIFAYQGREILFLMVAGRVLMGLGVAITGGLVAGNAATHRAILGEPGGQCHTGHDHDHRHGSRAAGFVEHMTFDFAFMARFMMIGALIAALIQTVVPQDAIDHVADTAVLAILAMMLLAFALALCSESDAILISSFVQFSPAAQLAFLVFGPMVDTKLATLYSGAFGARFARLLVPTVALATFIACLWLEAIRRIG